MLIMNRSCIHSIVLGALKTWKKVTYKIWSQLGNFYVKKMTSLEWKLATLQNNLRKMKDGGWRSTKATTKKFENPLPSTIENPIEILIAPTKFF
jgi:hypothetical protein